jgi:hypothetical protein
MKRKRKREREKDGDGKLAHHPGLFNGITDFLNKSHINSFIKSFSDQRFQQTTPMRSQLPFHFLQEF